MCARGEPLPTPPARVARAITTAAAAQGHHPICRQSERTYHALHATTGPRTRMKFAIAQRVEMVLLYGECGRCFKRTLRRFNADHPGNGTTLVTLTSIVKKFMQTGSVADAPRSGRPRVGETEAVTVLGAVSQRPTLSVSRIAREHGFPPSTVRCVLRRHNLYPYRVTPIQELSWADYGRRVDYCERTTDMLRSGQLELSHIIFTDEASFSLDGCVNRQNYRHWAEVNPHVAVAVHTQTPQHLNVWAGTLGGNIIGPVFLPPRLNGEVYLRLLEDVIDPLITVTVENDVDAAGVPVLDEGRLCYQHDGAPPHSTRAVREYLDRGYPGRWMGRGGPMAWPPRSPDLTPLDFFLWGHLKSVVYSPRPHSLQDLRHRIVQECAMLTPATLGHVRDEFEQRLYHCLAVNGEQFEHLLG